MKKPINIIQEDLKYLKELQLMIWMMIAIIAQSEQKQFLNLEINKIKKGKRYIDNYFERLFLLYLNYNYLLKRDRNKRSKYIIGIVFQAKLKLKYN